MNNYREKINENNAELRECIDIAENLPDACTHGDFTLQDFVDGRRTLKNLYDGLTETTDEDIGWIAEVDTDNITSTSRMFANCPLLTKVPYFNTSSVTTTDNMFYGCSALKEVPQFDLSNATNTSYMFQSCKGLTKSPSFDLSNVTNASYMFYGCTSLTEVGALLNTGKITNFSQMFYNCKLLTEAPMLDLSSATSTYMLFAYNNFTSVPPLDYSKVTDLSYTFYYCPIENAEISVDNATKINYLFCGDTYDTKLKTARILKTSKVTSMDGLLNGRQGLTSLYIEDMRNVTSASYPLQYCFKIESFYTKNIKVSLIIGSGANYAKLLTTDNLISLIYELRETSTAKTLTVGSNALSRLASVYVRTIDITDEMRLEDDLIDEKLPFEVCESTDEGAVPITDYVVLKNWQLA